MKVNSSAFNTNVFGTAMVELLSQMNYQKMLSAFSMRADTKLF